MVSAAPSSNCPVWPGGCPERTPRSASPAGEAACDLRRDDPLVVRRSYEIFVEGQTEVWQLPCSHQYCGACIYRWLRNNDTCPLCRLVV